MSVFQNRHLSNLIVFPAKEHHLHYQAFELVRFCLLISSYTFYITQRLEHFEKFLFGFLIILFKMAKFAGQADFVEFSPDTIN